MNNNNNNNNNKETTTHVNNINKPIVIDEDTTSINEIKADIDNIMNPDNNANISNTSGEDRHINNYLVKPLLNEANLRKLLKNPNIKMDKKTNKFINFIAYKFANNLMMELVECKYFEKSRSDCFNYKNKSVSAKTVLETFYTLKEYESISRDMNIGDVSPTLESLCESVIRNSILKKKVGSVRNYQANEYFLKNDGNDEQYDSDNEDDEQPQPQQSSSDINPLFYHEIDNHANFLKKVKVKSDNSNKDNKQ